MFYIMFCSQFLLLIQVTISLDLELCFNLTDPDWCIDSVGRPYDWCNNGHCCHTNYTSKPYGTYRSCTTSLNQSMPSNPMNDISSTCNYETSTAIYNLDKLNIDSQSNMTGWYYNFFSTNNSTSSFYHKNVSLWYNMCGIPNLSSTLYHQAAQYINNSITICVDTTEETKETNRSIAEPLCTS